MKKQEQNGNSSISMLKGEDRVRKRPAVIFGSDDLEGCKHAVFEILSNAIDEAREGYGDTIIVRNPWEILRYQVVDIKIIQPYESDKIRIQKGKDMVTLLTCHPYRGHGKYRYVVYCERNHGQTAAGKKEKKISDSSKDEIRKEEMIRYCGVLLLILLLGVRIRKMKKRS